MNKRSLRMYRATILGERFLARAPYKQHSERHCRGKNFRRAMKWFRVMNRSVKHVLRRGGAAAVIIRESQYKRSSIRFEPVDVIGNIQKHVETHDFSKGAGTPLEF